MKTKLNRISFEKYIELQVVMLANYEYDSIELGLKYREGLSPKEAKNIIDTLLAENNCEVEHENKTE